MEIVREGNEYVSILEKQQHRESSARTYARTFPIVPVKAEGMMLVGADGRRYLDCLSGAGTLALGHNHPVVVEAIRRTVDSGAPLHVLDLATPIKDQFCDELFGLLPKDLADHARIQFCGPAGTDAVEAAWKLVQTASGRSGMFSFTGAYHGMTSGALALTGALHAKLESTGAHAVTRLPFPYSYRCPFGIGGDDGARVGAKYLSRMLRDPNGGVLPPAGLIVEPVQGEGGVIPAPDFWMQSLRHTTSEHDIPLIADEVQTGVGRTGAMWGVDHSGVVPDVMVLSKAIGGGLPLAVVVYHERLDTWEMGAHAGTFRGNQLAMAAGASTLAFVARNELAERASELGARMLRSLTELHATHSLIGDVRGRGLMLGVEIVDPLGPVDELGARSAAPELASEIRSECLDRGLIIELGGRHGAVARLLPPLVMTDEEAVAVLDRFADAVAVVERRYLDRVA